MNGDSIYNGADDDASGVTAVTCGASADLDIVSRSNRILEHTVGGDEYDERRPEAVLGVPTAGGDLVTSVPR